MNDKTMRLVLLAVVATALAFLVVMVVLPSRAPRRPPEPERPVIAVALSGGGYRAALHGLAALRALEDLGLLERVEVVSAVSGASVTAGLYVLERRRNGDQFSFKRFEQQLLTLVERVEVPRTIVAAETVTAGLAVLRGGVACVGSRVFELWQDFRKTLNECVLAAGRPVRETDLFAAMREFSGNCNVQGCPNRAATLKGTAALAVLWPLVGEDGVEDIRRSFCVLREMACPDLGRDDRPRVHHPFAELLDVAVFGRQSHVPGRSPRVGDLARTKPLLVVNAATNAHGDPWVATPRGAGVRGAADGSPTAWRDYGSARGPLLADVVAASACHPLFCRPLPAPWPADRATETLVDGGIHDNVGFYGLRDAVRAESLTVKLLVVADSRRPYTPVAPSHSRLETMLRTHDLIIEQRMHSTLGEAGTWAQERGCPMVLVGLAPPPEAGGLGQLPTDMRPIRSDARKMMEADTAKFAEALQANPCVRRWRGARPP